MTITKIGREEGIEEGIGIGIEIGELRRGRSQLSRQLQRKLGALPPEVVQQIESLSFLGLDELSDAIFSLDTLGDLQNWLDHQPSDRFTT